MTTDQPELTSQKIIQDILDYTSMKISTFSHECGFKGGTRIYAVFNEDRQLGLDTYCSIINRFPELNGDRFIRKSGPLLLTDLCKPMPQIEELPQVLSEKSEKTEEYYQVIIEGKNREIELLKNQVAFMEKLFDRKV